MKIDYENDAYVEVYSEVEEPPVCRVILFNDDYTTVEFVIDSLKSIFHKTDSEAKALTGTVHSKGSAVIGVYTHDIAATKVSVLRQNARKNGFPLQCQLEIV